MFDVDFFTTAIDDPEMPLTKGERDVMIAFDIKRLDPVEIFDFFHQ